jgi:hypothetical protein
MIQWNLRLGSAVGVRKKGHILGVLWDEIEIKIRRKGQMPPLAIVQDRWYFRLNSIQFIQQRVCKLASQVSTTFKSPTPTPLKEKRKNNLKRRHPIPISTTSEESHACIIIARHHPAM